MRRREEEEMEGGKGRAGVCSVITWLLRGNPLVFALDIFNVSYLAWTIRHGHDI
jgi:hypothetical protein